MYVAQLEDDAGAVRLSFAGPVFELVSIDLGDDSEEQLWLKQQPHSGAVLAATRTDITAITMEIQLMPQLSVAAMEAAMAALHLELKRTTNIFRWQPDGGAAVVYNTYKSPTRKSLFRGQGGLLPGDLRRYDPHPIPILLPRDPTPRSGVHV